MVRLIIKNKRVEVVCKDYLWKELRKVLEIKMEKHYFSGAFKSGTWDGWFRFYEKEGKFFNIGLLQVFVANLVKEEIEYNIVDPNKKRDLSWVEFGESFKIKERDYQREGIEKFIKNRYGIWIVPTRGGKTYMSAESLRLLRHRFLTKKSGQVFNSLFVVDTDDLFSQAVNDFSIVLNCKKEMIGKIKGQNVDMKDISVSTIQTILSLKKKSQQRKKDQKDEKSVKRWIEAKKFMDWYRKLDVLIVDEIQEYNSKKRRDLLKMPRSLYFKLGISATPWEEGDDFTKYRLLSQFGPVLLKVKENRLKNRKVISKSIVILLKNSKVLLSTSKALIKPPLYKDSTYIEKYKYCLVLNEIRNNIIIEVIRYFKSKEIKILVLFNRVDHGKIISKATGEVFIYGSSKKDVREKYKEEFLKGERNVLLASDIYKKGITLPEAVVSFNVAGGASGSNIIQKRGRVLGATEEKKKSIIIDFVDDFQQYQTFKDHSIKRIEAYQRVSKDQHINFIDTDKDEDWIFELAKITKNWLNK